jgi:hypothetical protein
MGPEEFVQHTASDPNGVTDERGFTVSFVKSDDRASISSSIRSVVDRMFLHTDIDVEDIQVYYEDEDTYKNMKASDFTGDGEIVSAKGRVPIESLKINSNPRSTRGYANIISNQGEVNISND